MLYLTDGFDDERVKEVMTFFHHPEPGSTFWLHIIDDELLGYPAVFECATRADLQRAVSALEADVSETAESVVLELLFHPGFADETLMRLAQNPRYTTPLGHRSGPQELLEFLADRYAYPEAVTTLALHYYGAPQAGAKPFAAFLERYKGVEMLEYNLLNAQNLDPAKAAIVAKVFPQET